MHYIIFFKNNIFRLWVTECFLQWGNKVYYWKMTVVEFFIWFSILGKGNTKLDSSWSSKWFNSFHKKIEITICRMNRLVQFNKCIYLFDIIWQNICSLNLVCCLCIVNELFVWDAVKIEEEKPNSVQSNTQGLVRYDVQEKIILES